MNPMTNVVTTDCIKRALSEQIQQIPTPQPEQIKSSWLKVAQSLTPAVKRN